MLNHGCCCGAQWGSLDFHKKSLANLGEAMKRTRKLCAVMIDTIGRELIINRPHTEEADGWPKFEAGISVNAGDKVPSPCRASGSSSPLSQACGKCKRVDNAPHALVTSTGVWSTV